MRNAVRLQRALEAFDVSLAAKMTEKEGNGKEAGAATINLRLTGSCAADPAFWHRTQQYVRALTRTNVRAEVLWDKDKSSFIGVIRGTRPPLEHTPHNVRPSARGLSSNTAEPAHTIINRLGGVRTLSRALGLTPAAVTRWQKPRTETNKDGCDGVIPEHRRVAIMAVARKLNAPLKKADFLKS